MASTATFVITGQQVGNLEGASDNVSITLTNSSAVGVWSVVTATTIVGTAPSVATQSSAKFLLVIPPQTNNIPLQLTNSTAENGIKLSSQGASLLTIVGGSSYYLWANGTTAVANVRIGQF